MLTTQSSYDESYLAAQVYVMQIEFLLQTDEIKRIEIISKFNFSRENPRTCLNNGNNDVAALICFGPHSDSMSCTRTSRQSTVGAVRGVAQWVVRWFSGWWGGTATAARVNRMRSVLVLHVARALG